MTTAKFWTTYDCVELLTCTDIDEALEEAEYAVGDVVTVYGYAPKEGPKLNGLDILNGILEELHDDYGNWDEAYDEISDDMIAAAEKLARVIERDYKVWQCGKVCEVQVRVTSEGWEEAE